MQIKLPFLGERDYIQSSTLFDYLIQNNSIYGKISYQFTKPIFTSCIKISPEKKEGYSSLFAYGDSFENQLYTYEEACDLPLERIDFNEENLLKNAQLFEESAKFTSSKCMFSQTLIATTKKIHKEVFQIDEQGQWLMVRIDLNILPFEEEQEYLLEFVNKKNKQLTCMKIVHAGNEVGRIYFSWRKDD